MSGILRHCLVKTNLLGLLVWLLHKLRLAFNFPSLCHRVACGDRLRPRLTLVASIPSTVLITPQVKAVLRFSLHPDVCMSRDADVDPETGYRMKTRRYHLRPFNCRGKLQYYADSFFRPR